MGYIRSIENETLVKDRHVVFSSFVTSCNTFLVVLTYRLVAGDCGKENGINTQNINNNKLYIFVL
jgi:hypothetical protein